ncbi:MAG: hypothetical protein Q8L34_05705 [Candidatus Woesearchaeota archaeon]|nr:hypothetical protein [Candidatus Woesearchaeota archaeon]
MKPALLSSRDLGFTVGAALTQLQHLQLPGEQAAAFLTKQLPMFRVRLNPSSPQKFVEGAYASLSLRYIYRYLNHDSMQARTVDVTVYLRHHPKSISYSLGA